MVAWGEAAAAISIAGVMDTIAIWAPTNPTWCEEAIPHARWEKMYPSKHYVRPIQTRNHLAFPHNLILRSATRRHKGGKVYTAPRNRALAKHVSP